MRKYFALLLLLLLVPAHAFAQNRDAETTAMAFFDATRAGNVGRIRALIADPLRKNTRVLLTENKAYPDFLRNRYAGATAEVTRVSALPDGDMLVDMAVTFQSNTRSLMRLRLSQHKGGGWRVVEQSQVY